MPGSREAPTGLGLILSAYDADSHRYWRRCIVEMVDRYRWAHLTLPPRHFAWHAVGAPLLWREEDPLTQNPEVVLASSTVDLNRLVGLFPSLARARLILYFHDNQFAYPRQPGQRGTVELQVASVYSAMTAERLAFNSEFNRETFLAGVQALMDKLPRGAPRCLPEELSSKAVVLPIPVDELPAEQISPATWPGWWKARGIVGRPPSANSLIITWAARWEYDKNPERLLAILRGLAESQVDFRISIIGRQFRRSPDEFAAIRELFSDHLLCFGYLDSRDDYGKVLQASHVCLSTASHEFQGLAVLEAVTAGCSPLVPDEVVYPEIYSRLYRYESVAEAIQKLIQIQQMLPERLPSVPDVSHYFRANLKSEYVKLLG